MATTIPARTTLGANLRRDFPILQQENDRGQRLSFLDSAASSQKPQVVIDAVSSYYAEDNANIHRGVYTLSERATARYEEARQEVSAFINAASAKECIFTRNTTEAINLVAQSWGRANVCHGDLIVITEMDHHSNIVPWQLLAEAVGAEIAAVGITDDGRLDLESLDRLLAREPKVVAFPHVSNALGTVNPAAEIIRRAKQAGAMVLVDSAQGTPHLPVDVRALGADFLAFSGHKVLAPMGSGVLWGRLDLLQSMPPFLGGGGMIRKVEIGRSTWADVPARFEAGTPAVGDAVGLGAALRYLTRLDMAAVSAHEEALTRYALERLAELPGVTVFGPPAGADHAGVISFTVEEIHPHDIASVLSGENVAVRAGHHCCQPLMARLGVVATTRASFSVYSDRDDVDRLAEAIMKAQRIFAA